MFSIGLAIVMFTVVVLLLVALLMVARNKMVPSGDVSITINEDSSKVMKLAAAQAIADLVGDDLAEELIIPSPFDDRVAPAVATAVAAAARHDGVARR